MAVPAGCGDPVPDRPDGSPRNLWQVEVEGMEPHGDTVRVELTARWPLLADVTPLAVAELNCAPGKPIGPRSRRRSASVHGLTPALGTVGQPERRTRHRGRSQPRLGTASRSERCLRHREPAVPGRDDSANRAPWCP